MRDLTWLTYVMLILASYRLTHLIVFDKITEFLRKPFLRRKKIVENGVAKTKKEPTSLFGYLVNCYWCAGIWVAAFLGVFYLLYPSISSPIIFILSIAGGQAVLETAVGVAVKTVQVLDSAKPKA